MAVSGAHARAPSASRAAHREQAWREYLIAREGNLFRAITLAAIIVVPGWIPVDAFLEPEHAWVFGVMRAFLTLALLMGFVLIRSPRASLEQRRWSQLALIVAIALVGGYMLPRVTHTSFYVLGFSTALWGVGISVIWPAAFSITAQASMVISYAVQQLYVHGTGDLAEGGGAFAYLASAAVISALVAAARFASERKLFEAQFELAERNRSLDEALVHLKDAQDRLVQSEKLSALGRLLAQLSHELNNPVNIIENNARPISEYWREVDRALELAHASELDPTSTLAAHWHDADLDYIRRDMPNALNAVAWAAQRIHGVHHDLRTYLRGEVAELVEMDLNEPVRSTVQMVGRERPDDASVELETVELPPIRGRSGQISQVVLNLVQNALDVVGPKGHVRVRTEQHEDEAWLTVEDDGPGVTATARSRLFEPFFTTKDVGKGTGLGLATSRQILEQHGGRLYHDASYERGARFVAVFPLAHAGAPEASPQ